MGWEKKLLSSIWTGRKMIGQHTSLNVATHHLTAVLGARVINKPSNPPTLEDDSFTLRAVLIVIQQVIDMIPAKEPKGVQIFERSITETLPTLQRSAMLTEVQRVGITKLRSVSRTLGDWQVQGRQFLEIMEPHNPGSLFHEVSGPTTLLV
jgi:hypothetical protein